MTAKRNRRKNSVPFDERLHRAADEARAAAAVSHPNIVILHDMGEDDAVGLFLVF